MDFFEQFKKKIEDSDAIVIGFGNECATDIKAVIRENSVYISKKDDLARAVQDDLISEADLRVIEASIYFHELSSNLNPIINADIERYNKLYDLVKDRNYFVVTTNYDDVIFLSKFGLDLEAIHIVSPCGSISRLQSQCNCNEIKENDDIFLGEPFYKELYMTMEKNNDISLIKEKLPHCTECKATLTINVYGNGDYNENGYINKWNEYTRWLQTSLNKKLVLIELGVDFSVPTIVRWPFEKMALLNYKATIFRVNEKFPQLAAEIKDKGYSLNMNAKEFIFKFQ